MTKRRLFMLCLMSMAILLLPAAAFAEDPEPLTPVVTDLTINDAICPINGEAPVTSFDSSDQFSGTIDWGSEDLIFSPGMPYTATITLTPKEDFTFEGVEENAFIIPGAKSVTNEADSGVITAVFMSPYDGYITDGHGLAAYRIFGSQCDIMSTYKGAWISTTYANRGYGVGYRLGEDGDTESLSAIGSPVEIAEGLTLKAAPVFSNSGRFIDLTFTVVNSGSEAAVLSFGAHADIQIDADDSAPITAFEDGRGFKMVNRANPDMQFNFFGKGTVGVTDVDTFWFGPFGSRLANLFNQVDAPSFTDGDSGMAYAWVNRSIPANSTRIFRTTMGAGDAQSGESIPIGVNFDSQGGSDVPAVTVANAGGTVSKPADPTRSKYKFTGWYTEADCTNLFDFSTPITSTITLYAGWKHKQSGGGGSSNVTVNAYPVTVADGITGGTVTVSPGKAFKNDLVTITAAPDEGMQVATVTVTDKDGKAVPTSGSGERVTFQMPAGGATVNATFVKQGEVPAPAEDTIIMRVGAKEYTIFGKNATMDTAPVINSDNRTLVPIRFVSEALDATVDWNEEARTVTITRGETVIVMTIGEESYTVNGEARTMDTAPIINEDSRTLVPVRFVSKALGATVDYADGLITIHK